MDQLVESLNKFSLETLQRVNTNSKIDNTIFSPYSAFVCVAMSAPIFKDETRAEILRSIQISVEHSQIETVLHQLHELIDDENTNKVSTSNRIWANKKLDFSPETFALNKKILGIPIAKANFPQPACDEINREVNRTTKGMIPKLVDPSDFNADTAIVLLNAIYFNSDWEKKFEIDSSSNSPEGKNFTLADGTEIHTTMLRSSKRNLPYYENDKFQVVSIPYKGNQYDFVVILPKENNESGYEELTKLTYVYVINGLLHNLSNKTVNILLPKFSFESKIQLNEIFQSLGLRKGFSEKAAECTDKKVQYFINSIIQKAKIVLDENGTVAAAATAMRMTFKTCKRERVINVDANHPFVYLLRNKNSGSILFEGFVKNPSA